MKERQGDGLQLMTSNLQNVSPLFFKEDRPTSDPESSPKDHLQNRFIVWFIKTKSFLLIHIAQHRVVIPIKRRFLCSYEKLLSQGPNRCCTSMGLLIPNIKATHPHTSLAIRQSKKRCWTVSCWAQKQHFVHPFHLVLRKSHRHDLAHKIKPILPILSH
jgi:hypothetical protein